MEDMEHVAATIRNAVRDFPVKYHKNKEKIAQLERERIDLLHFAELVDLNASEGFRLYKEIQDVEQERRILKDENEQLKHIEPILRKWRDWLGQLDQAVKGIYNEKKKIENRSYRCRVRKDLEDRINGVRVE